MRLPQVGSVWLRNGRETFRFVNVDSHVLLMGDTGVSRVSIYEWPPAGLSELHPGRDPARQEAPPRCAMLVGGATGRHFTRLWEQAAEINIDIEYHWPVDVTHPPAKLPSDVDLLIGLVSHVSHKNLNSARALAKSRNVPIALVPSSGFRHSLQLELERLSIDPAQFGGEGSLTWRGDRTVWTWTGSGYVHQELDDQAWAASPASALALMGAALLGGVVLDRKSR